MLRGLKKQFANLINCQHDDTFKKQSMPIMFR